MTTFTVDDQHMKELIKQALLELFQERRELFTDVFDELIEDIGLANAMQEAEDSEVVSEEEVMTALKG